MIGYVFVALFVVTLGAGMTAVGNMILFVALYFQRKQVAESTKKWLRKWWYVLKPFFIAVALSLPAVLATHGHHLIVLGVTLLVLAGATFLRGIWLVLAEIVGHRLRTYNERQTGGKQ